MPETIEIHHLADVAAARREARRIAAEIGFDQVSVEEIGLAVSELASNLVKHAGGGAITLSPLSASGRRGMQIESVDGGRGIRDVEEAVTDGFSTSGSLGYGLGTVNRMMHEFNISSNLGAQSGTYVVGRRWIRENLGPAVSCPLDIAAASRPHLGTTVNGDAAVIKKWKSCALAAVIDGLGHGQFAHRAAQKAVQYVDRHFDLPLEEIFRGVNRECRSTRGVVMALARFDCEENVLTFASVGNIETRVMGGSEPPAFRLRRGIVGLNAPKPMVTRHPWNPEQVLVLHSDGLKSHWSWDEYVYLAGQPASALAQKLLHDQARDNDDATVVVVKSLSSSPPRKGEDRL